MVSYMVLDMLWRDYTVFATEEDARLYITEQLDIHADMTMNDFKLFKREEIAL